MENVYAKGSRCGVGTCVNICACQNACNTGTNNKRAIVMMACVCLVMFVWRYRKTLMALVFIVLELFCFCTQALGTAQIIDGLVHLFYPSFYHDNPAIGLGCAGNIFYGAGLLGIFSAYH